MRPLCSFLLVLVACTQTPRDEGIGFGTGGGDSGDGGGAASGEEPGGGDDGGETLGDDDGDDGGGVDEDSGGGALFDVGGGTLGSGCSKVDFLFVVDDSGSMLDEQQNLANSFPGFISAIGQTLEVDDFHLMVVTPTAAGGGCEGTLGAGRIRSGAGVDCGVGPTRFADGSTEDLLTAFTCMASVGTDGDGDEQVVGSVLRALGEESAPGGCNEDFLRDDAILVVTLITDEEDGPGDEQELPGLFPPYEFACGGVDDDDNSPGEPSAWFDELVALKGGDEDAVVLLALVGDCDVGECEPVTLGGADGNVVTGSEPAPRLRQLASSFTHGHTGPVCASDYAPFFSDAVAFIDTACNEFEPEG